MNYIIWILLGKVLMMQLYWRCAMFSFCNLYCFHNSLWQFSYLLIGIAIIVFATAVERLNHSCGEIRSLV